MFQDREEAGQILAKRLGQTHFDGESIVLGIPRGGMVVAKVVADSLKLPLLIIIVKKVRSPDNPELAIGAVGPENTKVIDWDLALRLNTNQEYLDKEIEERKKEVEERMRTFQISEIDKKLHSKKNAILVDDGIATGATAEAAIKYLRAKEKESKLNIILAVPVIARDSYERLKRKADKIIALEISESFSSVGQFYREFPQISDEEVIKLIKDNR